MKRLYIDDTLHEALKKRALTDGRTLEWVTTQAIDSYLYPTTPFQEPRFQEPRTVLNDVPNLGDVL